MSRIWPMANTRTRYNTRMAISVKSYPHALACQDAVMELAQRAKQQNKRPVLLVPSYTHQLAAQQWLARRNAGFGVAVTTPWSWTENLWELFGDGTLVVSGQLRMVELWKSMQENQAVLQTPGMLNLLNGLALNALPFIDNPTDLAPQECAAIDVLRTYRARIRELGLTEPSEALVRLSRCTGLEGFAPILLDIAEDDLTHVQRTFLGAANAVLVQNAMTQPSPVTRNRELLQAQSLLFQRTDENIPVTPGGALRFALSAGPSAAKRITCDAVLQALNDGCATVVVAAKDPCSLFDFAQPILRDAGYECSLDVSKPLKETDMGRAFLDLAELVSSAESIDPIDAHPLTAADFAYNPFSSVSRTSAFRTDKLHRGNRLTDEGTILTDLAADADDITSGVINRIEEHRYLEAIDAMQQYLDKRFRARPAYHAEQSRVLDTLRTICSIDASLPMEALIAMVARSSIVCNAGTCDSAPVKFTTQIGAAALAPGSVDCVVVTNLTTEELPVKNPESSLVTLMDKLGVANIPDPLAHARATFYSALEAARTRVVLQRNLNNEEGDPNQPATVFEELLDCYRADPQSNDDVDRTLGITKNLIPFVVQRGEEDALASLGVEKRAVITADKPETGALSPEIAPFIVLPYRYSEGTFDGLDMSPSQIESYLECPYSWFAKRRLRLEGIDEGFGPMERGTFMHAVLHDFYLRFQGSVQPKVTHDTLDQARQIMRETFQEACEHQPFARPGSRYVPITAWERKERDAVLQNLLDYLEMEAKLLPRFRPREFEWQFANARPVHYAGCNLRGCVDRIDVDDNGHAVVIDYKSSLSKEYCLYNPKAEASEEFQLPQHMQALMYSKVVEEAFGVHVVAALYVNPLKLEIAGAFDATVVGSLDLPFSSATWEDASRVPYRHAETFEELIASCEREIESRLRALKLGHIEPDPVGQHACEHCPVNTCPRRLDPRKF